MDIQLLRPTFAPYGLMSTPGARTGRQWSVRAGMTLQYERGPLVVINQTDEIAKVVSDRVGFNFGGYVTVLPGLGFGLSIPMYAQAGDYVGYQVPGFALGDLVVVDIAPVPYDRGFGGYVEAMSALDLASVERRSDADAALTAEVPDPTLRAFLLQNLVASDGAYEWRINLPAIAAGLPGLSDFPPVGPSATFAEPALFIAS